VQKAEFRRGVHFGRRLSPPHRPETPGKAKAAIRRPQGTTGLFHTAILYPTPPPRSADALYRVIQAGIPLDGRQRSRRQRGALPARSRRETAVELYWGPAQGTMAAQARRIAGDVHAPARPRRPLAPARNLGRRKALAEKSCPQSARTADQILGSRNSETACNLARRRANDASVRIASPTSTGRQHVDIRERKNARTMQDLYRRRQDKNREN